MNILRAWKDRRGKADRKLKLPTSRTWPLCQDSGFGSSSISSSTTTSDTSYRSASLDSTTTPAMQHSGRVLSGPTRRHLHRSDSHSHPLPPPPSPPLYPHHHQYPPSHKRGPTPPPSMAKKTIAGVPAATTEAPGPSPSRRFMIALSHLLTSLKKPSARRPELDTRSSPVDPDASAPPPPLSRPSILSRSLSHSYLVSSAPSSTVNTAPYTIHSFLGGQSAPLSPSTLVPEISAPAVFPGTGPLEMAAKRQQLLQIQQCTKRKPALSSSFTPSLVTSTTTSSISTVASNATAATSGAVTGGLGGKAGRHLIPHHHNDTAPSCMGPSTVSGLDSSSFYSPGSLSPLPCSSSSSCCSSPRLIRRDSASSYTSSILSLPSSRYTPVLFPNDPPSPRLSSLSPLGTQPPSSHWRMPRRRRVSLTTRSMDEMEVVVTNSSSTATSLPQEGEDDETLTRLVEDPAEDTVTNVHGRDSFPISSSTSKSLPASKPSILSPLSSSSSSSGGGAQRRLGQGYDITTMFQIGPLDPASSPTTLHGQATAL